VGQTGRRIDVCTGTWTGHPSSRALRLLVHPHRVGDDLMSGPIRNLVPFAILLAAFLDPGGDSNVRLCRKQDFVLWPCGRQRPFEAACKYFGSLWSRRHRLLVLAAVTIRLFAL
jgi:hypothetical protein